MLEIKSCTLVKDETALFPDAPTKRGVRHSRTLVEYLKLGRASILFLVQRGDAAYFKPNKKMDLEFTDSLRLAVEAGVEVYSYDCKDGTSSYRLVPRSLAAI